MKNSKLEHVPQNLRPTEQTLARERRLKARQDLLAALEVCTTASPRMSTPHRELFEAQFSIAPTIERDVPREGVGVGGAPGAPHGDFSDNDGDDEDRSRVRRSHLPSRPRTNPGSGIDGSDRGRIRLPKVEDQHVTQIRKTTKRTLLRGSS